MARYLRHQEIIEANADLFSIWLLSLKSNENVNEMYIKNKKSSCKKYIWKGRLLNVSHFVQVSMPQPSLA